MRVVVCVTTYNRTDELKACLNCLWSSEIKPYRVIISDNSPTLEKQLAIRQIATSFSETVYVEGSHTGVASNRNKALSLVPHEADLVCFLADDICVQKDFFSQTLKQYAQMSQEDRERTILSGECIECLLDNMGNHVPVNSISLLKLTFRGYFAKSNTPEVISQYSTVYPQSFFDHERWDDNIFMGQEDAELSLRARSLGYTISYCPGMKVVDIAPNRSSLGNEQPKSKHLSQYEIYAEASRLYIGIKRYMYLFPNPLKLVGFISIYFLHMTLYLARRNSLSQMLDIILTSKVANILAWHDNIY